MKNFLICIVVSLLVGSVSFAEPAAQQHPTQSWFGLTGLYVIPTARTMGGGNWGLSYNESKHVEWIGSGRFVDRQVRASITYGVNNDIEIYGGYARDLINTGDGGFTPVLPNETFNQFGLKWKFMNEGKNRPAVAFAIRDIFDNMTDIGTLKNVNNGRKYFLLASKRIVDNESTGRFLDAHIGVAKDKQVTSGLFGMELALSPTISYIAEGMWDSPFLNFYGMYMNPTLRAQSDKPGRFIFDMGLRFYPDIVPGFVIDTGFVADGQPEFSFGFSYTTGL
ncbi:MAG: hypothetical protein NT018_13865 [Armatimonadetes bacterium]|nr:hypothetical protein [Armatimonadota bacterium]